MTKNEIWEVNNKSSNLSDWVGNWQGLLKLHGSKFPEYDHRSVPATGVPDFDHNVTVWFGQGKNDHLK